MPNINQIERFARVPNIDRPRSIFNKSSGLITTGNIGDVIPIYCDFLYPGTTVRMHTNKVVRLQTVLTPFMGNIYADVHWFFVPMRLTWIHTREFFGENNQSAWIPQTTYQVPSISAPSGGFQTGTLADYFGLPVGVEWTNSDPRRPMALPFRAYALICNDFWRSENITDPLNISVGDSNQTGTNGGSYINDVANGGKPFKAAKFFDRFTGCLATPQKGPSVQFGTTAAVTVDGYAPVGVSNVAHSGYIGDPPGSGSYLGLGFQTASSAVKNIITDSSGYYKVDSTITVDSDTGATSGWNSDSRRPVNLWADLADTLDVSGVSFSINELRLAFQLQRYYEAIARSGEFLYFCRLCVIKTEEKIWKAA